MEFMPIKPSSLHHSIGEAFWHDARDFLGRFDALWEHDSLMHKSGRTKSFVDLMMGCECALKAHVFISNTSEDCSTIYRRIRDAGHHVSKLMPLASFMQDRTHYDRLEEKLGKLGVSIRYSLDADGLFFPLISGSREALTYSQLVGSEVWVKEVRESLKALIDAALDEFTGQIEMSDGLVPEIERDKFVTEHVLKGSRRQR